MVFIIKSDQDNYIDKICKTMINMEHNLHIFDKDGLENKSIDAQIPFNKYTYNQIDYDISIPIGYIHIYTPKSISFEKIHRLLEAKLTELDKNNATNYACSPEDLLSTQYTLLTVQINKKPYHVNKKDEHYRIIKKYIQKKNAYLLMHKFCWYVYINKCPLVISELSPIQTYEYLMKSISTIIYDGHNLFNNNCDIKQINYPAITQYCMFDKKQIIDRPISISNTFGLYYEIIRCYTDDSIINKYCHDDYKKSYNTIDFNKYTIQPFNKLKKWHDYLEDLYKETVYDKTKKQTTKIKKVVQYNSIDDTYKYDVCFFTGAPLYNSCYIIKIGLIDNTETKDNT